ncbi:response regulator transcription factor [Collimonas silvisoli]|uniref:response regulator transcription factor n=1 Tax=Collimonas silvisoli TaxID=2825884 RepID=UPI001B8B8466|nr:response regulator transcription factor [Collimonas silvisoli]
MTKLTPPSSTPAFKASLPNNPDAIKVVVADDHPVVVIGISDVLKGEPDIQLLSAALTITELFETLRQISCDVLITDYSFDDDNEPDGMHLLERVRRMYPLLKIVLLTAHDDIVVVRQAMKLGVLGFISKRSGAFTGLPTVIRSVMAGEKYLDPATSKLLLEYMLENNPGSQALTEVNLSKRELEVVRLFVSGKTVTEIANLTDRSLKTISTQKSKAMVKLGAHNDVELINAFNRIGGTRHHAN